MQKRVRVTDADTGVVDFEQLVDVGYAIQYTLGTDYGQIHIMGKIDNARYGEKHWIKNWLYEPIAQRLIEKFEELRHIRASRILFIEDTEFEESRATKESNKWIARVKKAKRELEETWGYRYVIESRTFYVDRLNREQLIAVLYHELRHIGLDGDLIPHEVEDWNSLIGALGAGWQKEHTSVDDLLADDFMWSSQSHRQINLVEYQERRKDAV